MPEPTRCYHLFGLCVASDLPVPAPVVKNAVPDMCIREDPTIRLPLVPVFSCQQMHPAGVGEYAVFDLGSAVGLRVSQVGEFICSASGITYRLFGGVTTESAMWSVMGLVFAVWLEGTGRIVLHGATVAVNGGAVGFLGASGAGKSTLVMSLSRDFRILGDDHVVLQTAKSAVLARPALPWLKLTPAVLTHYKVDPEGLGLLHSGHLKRRFDIPISRRCDEVLPLKRLYLLRRDRTTQVTMTRKLNLGDAWTELIRNSYVPRTMAATGQDRRRLPVLARLAEDVGLTELRYPDSLDRLHEVASVVRADCQLPDRWTS